MKKAIWILSFVALLAVLSVNSANAMPQFFAAFRAKYLKTDDQSETGKALKDQVDKVKCNVCHGKNGQGKDDKKVRNAYGEALDKLLSKEDIKNKDKIQEALDKVAEEKVDEAEDAPTFGDRLAGGKLPSQEEEAEQTASK